MKYLVEKAGADVNARNNNGEMALFDASDAEFVKALLKAGADVNARDGNGHTVLSDFVKRLERDEDYWKIVDVLKKAGAVEK